MPTLITGSTGFIGRHLTSRLAATGLAIRCLVRPMSDTTSLLGKANVELICADLGDKSQLRQIVKDVDVVYHLAFDYSRPSANEVHSLLEACLSEGVSRFVYFSSIAVVGLSSVHGVITEETHCHPDTEYARVKRDVEELLLDAHAKHGFPAVILRPTSVYGVGETDFWLPLFRAINSGRLSCLFGDGFNLLSLCFIDNLIEGALLAARRDAALGNVYILSDERPYAFREIVNEIADACSVCRPRFAIPRAFAVPAAQTLDHLSRLELIDPVVPFLSANVARWIAHYPCSVEKARAELGFTPIIGLREGVYRTAEWYRENGFTWHSLPWAEGALDLTALPRVSGSWRERAMHAGTRTAQLAWRLARLTWRLPPRVLRRMRRRTGRSRT